MIIFVLSISDYSNYPHNQDVILVIIKLLVYKSAPNDWSTISFSLVAYGEVVQS